jgi:hypothetical protein
VGLFQLSFQSTAYRSRVPSFSDQKLKLSEETRKIQFRQSFVLGHEDEYISGGRKLRGS